MLNRWLSATNHRINLWKVFLYSTCNMECLTFWPKANMVCKIAQQVKLVFYLSPLNLSLKCFSFTSFAYKREPGEKLSF
jgi:hypothetical protein